MSDTMTISSKSTAEQLDRCRITNYNPSYIGLSGEISGAPLEDVFTQAVRDSPSIEELEDEADIAIGRERLEEMKNNPSSVLRGKELLEVLDALLEGSDSVERK